MAGGSPRRPAQSSTDFARRFSGPRTRQASWDTTSWRVNPGTGVPATPAGEVIEEGLAGVHVLDRQLRVVLQYRLDAHVLREDAGDRDDRHPGAAYHGTRP